ncbi:acyltransferase domain-containing protein, partial [Streptomyces sp. SID8361]|uniref:type I polyketide synthase n=1 Tax=Streptomyces sp. MnatMP-M27 TaxID=1839768 RepID=UPI00081EF415
AGLAARDIDAVEAHGTGTTLGDLIEADALLATYGQDRDGRPPLRLGSLKSNIGHTQAAAGVAGVIKTVLAMRHGSLPRTLHVDRPSSRVDWGQGQLELLTRQTAWPETDRPLRAGVSSFGISGTNAHVILESAAPEPAAPRHTPADALPGLSAEAVPWVLSGKSRQAVRDQAARLLGRLEAGPTPDGADIGWSLVSTRAAFEYRAAVVGTGREELLTGLRALATGEAAAHLTEGRADDAARVAFVFPGQGAQWAGMARPLLDTSPVFARAMAECAAALTPFVDWSLLDVVDDAAALERVDVVQPVLWAVMVSLAELWRSYGVEPAAVAGHSQGEIAAACVAGVLSLQDGARVVALRSQAVAESLAGLGGMVALPLSEEAATELLGRWAGRLSLAAVNGPSSTVVSGEAPAVDELLAACGTAGIRARRIPVDYASHSPQVERIRDRLLADLAPVTPGAASVPAYSCTTGEQADTRTWDARHWYRNLRETVRFDSASRALVDAGVSVVLEVSPHPVLVAALQETLEAALPARPGRTALGTLRRDDGGPRRFLLSLAQLHTLGVGVRWEAVFGGAREVELPTYAFQHRRFWPEAGAEQRSDALDTEFWATVERADLGAVAAALGVADETLAPVLPALSSWRARRAEKSTVDQWHYRETWTPLRNTGRLSGSWLLVVDDAASEDPWTSAVTGAFAERAAVLRVQEPDRARLARELTALSTTDCAGVVVLVPDGVEGVVFVLVVLQAVL